MHLSGIRIMDLQGVFHLEHGVGSINHFYDRKNYGLVVVECGRLRFHCGDQVFICDQNHILLIPKGVSYLLSCEERCRHYTVNFDAVGSGLPNNFLMLNIEPGKNLLASLDKLYTTWEFHWDTAEYTCMSLIYEVFDRINFVCSRNSQQACRLSQIARSIEYLEKHFTDPMITNELIAEASRVSTVYFRKIFSENYGISPMRYVRKKRIEKAQNLMKNGYDNISEIAQMVGFNSIYHFSKTFKQMVGLSPTGYLRVVSAPDDKTTNSPESSMKRR